MTTTEHLIDPTTNETRVRNRVALVTGGTRGIGAAIVRRLAHDGAHVAVGYHRNRDSAHELQIETRTDYPDCEVSIHQGNVGNAADCRRVVREVIDQHGRLDMSSPPRHRTRYAPRRRRDALLGIES